MKPKETLEIRTLMADLHDSILKRIDDACKKKHYIEVCWLCYACFENRVNRILEKICSGCTKEKRNDNRHIGIRTKLECYGRLMKNHYLPMQSENYQLINTIKGWCKERNDLIHGLVSLDLYSGVDKKFENLAKRGVKLVNEMYHLGGGVRSFYYETEEIPLFDEKIIKACHLTKKCIKE